MAGSSRVVSSKRTWFLGLALLGLLLVMAVGAILWQVVELTSVATVSERIAGIKPVAAGIRLLLIALLALSWPQLIGFAVRKRNADERTQSHWLSLRWRVTGWLLVIELMLGQDLLGRFLAAINGPVT